MQGNMPRVLYNPLPEVLLWGLTATAGLSAGKMTSSHWMSGSQMGMGAKQLAESLTKLTTHRRQVTQKRHVSLQQTSAANSYPNA